jgi:hypothetical protein
MGPLPQIWHTRLILILTFAAWRGSGGGIPFGLPRPHLLFKKADNSSWGMKAQHGRTQSQAAGQTPHLQLQQGQQMGSAGIQDSQAEIWTIPVQTGAAFTMTAKQILQVQSNEIVHAVHLLSIFLASPVPVVRSFARALHGSLLGAIFHPHFRKQLSPPHRESTCQAARTDRPGGAAHGPCGPAMPEAQPICELVEI